MTQRRTKQGFPAAAKAVSGGAASGGRFQAVVSVFGNVDLVGDRVVKGAFAKSLAKWRTSGDPIPVIFSHDWQNPLAHVGKVTGARETDRGLVVEGELDLDNPFAAQVHRLLKERRIKEFSFGYDIVRERRASDGANELLELDIIEVGPTLKGMNPATELVGVKSAATVAAPAAPDAETLELIAAVKASGAAAPVPDHRVAAAPVPGRDYLFPHDDERPEVRLSPNFRPLIDPERAVAERELAAAEKTARELRARLEERG